ncbi:hypothetical protein IW152_005477, partial [Coemansia sp. BCRC 34962]
ASGLTPGETKKVGCVAEAMKIFCTKNNDLKPYSLNPPLTLLPVLIQEENEHNGIDLISFKNKTREQKHKRRSTSSVSTSNSNLNNKTLEYGVYQGTST